jgi:hypothetical protein
MASQSKAPGDAEGKAPARRKALLVVIITTAIVLMAAGVLMVLSPSGSRINLWFVFPGVCAVAGCYLASGLLGALAKGKVADALHTGIQVLTIALLFGLLAMFFPNAPTGILGFGLMLILTGSAAVGAYLAKAYSEHYWLVGRAAVIAILGLSLELGAALTTAADLLRGLPFMIGLTVALLSLLGILHEHSNPVARVIGRFFRNGPNMITITVVLTIVFVYALKLRDVIAQKAPDQTVLAEWIVVAVAMIVVGYKFYSQFRSRETQQDFCETRTLVQSICRDKGDTGYAQSVVDRFIAEGKREPLVVLITTVLVQGHTDPNEIEIIIGGVVRYTTTERRFAFGWALGDEAVMNKEERTKIAFDALDQTARVLGAAYLMSDRAGPAGIAEG